MEYFKMMIKDKDNDVRKWAAFNLPCFNYNFRNTSLENAEYFNDIYYDLICTNIDTTHEDILKTLASGIHEAIKIIPKD